MEVLTQRPLFPERTNSLFDGRTLWWPGAGQSPTATASEATFQSQAPPSPPYEMESKKMSLPPISDLLNYTTQGQRRSSDQHREDASRRRERTPPRTHRHSSSHLSPGMHAPPTPPGSVHTSIDHGMPPPLIMQPKHDIQRIDPALFDGSRHRQNSRTSPWATRPTLDTTYQPYSSSISSASAYPNSAPVVQSQYGDVSPRSAASAAPTPYYSRPHSNSTHSSTSHESRRYSTDLRPAPQVQGPSAGPAHDQTGRPLIPQVNSYAPQPPRSSFHPYDPRMHQRQPSQSSDTQRPHSSMASHSDDGEQGTDGHVTPGRNYPCKSCGKAFSRPSSLKIHEHSHTGAKPFICTRPGCGKSFSVRSNMKRHERGCHLGTPGSMGSMQEDSEASPGV